MNKRGQTMPLSNASSGHVGFIGVGRWEKFPINKNKEREKSKRAKEKSPIPKLARNKQIRGETKEIEKLKLVKDIITNSASRAVRILLTTHTTKRCSESNLLETDSSSHRLRV
ncbi:hypothetical protein TNCV_142531 [Trichonephila clavipes]|nr:hypothetical protein TNCV_142531 [Trichonephila clavipes]